LGVKGDVVPGAAYPILHIDGWLFSLLCVLSFTLMGAIGIAAGFGFRKRIYWARSLAVSFSLMVSASGIILALYAYPVLGILLGVLYLALLIWLFVGKQFEDAFPVWVSRYGRSSSQFSLLFLINATAFGSLVLGPLLPLLRFRHMAGGYVGVPLCSIGSIARSLSGNWADLLLAPIFLVAVLMLVGVLIGRALCGWACPIGFIQDLGARAKSALGLGDIELSRKGHERMKLVKYAILLFVLILAVDIGVSRLLSPDAHADFISGMTGFPLYQSGATPCEACPAPITGYFFPDDLVRNGLRGTFVLTPEAGLRLFVLIGFIGGALAMPRFFCRYFCPAGAMAALFNRTSALSIDKDQEKCTECNYCVTACPMRVHKLKEEHVDSRVHDMECTFCLECIDSCPERALSLTFQGRTVYKGGKEWWLRTLKETEGAGRTAQGAGEEGTRGKEQGSTPPSSRNNGEEAGPDNAPPSSRNDSIATGKGGAAMLVLLLASTALVPLLWAPAASGAQYDATNFPKKDASGNYSLGSRDVWRFSGGTADINGTVILNEEASLVVDGGAKVTIRGDLWLAGQSSVKVTDSQLTVFIPEQPPMRIEQLYGAPNGFMLVDELASVNLTNSRLRLARLQEPLMQGIVQPSYAEGRGASFTYKIEYQDASDRELSWMNVVIDGTARNMSKTDQNDTTARDGIEYSFATALPPGNHTYHFEGRGPDGPLRHPASGESPGPHVETDQPVFLYGSESIVNFGRFGAESSTMELEGSFYTHMSSLMELRKSQLTAGLTIEINPTCVFQESNIPSMVVKERTGRLNVFLYDCTVETAVMESFSNVLFERCTVANLDLQSNSVTTVIQSTIRSFNSAQNSSAYLDRAVIESGSMPVRMVGDSQVTAYNETVMGFVHMDDRARLYLTSATVENVSACNDARVWSEYATVRGYTLIDNATILNTLKVRATVNGAPAPVDIQVFSPGGDLLVVAKTRDDGFRSFAVPIRIIKENGSQVIESCTINISYRSLVKVQQFSLKDGTSDLNVSLEDTDAPRIRAVRFDYYYPSMGEALVAAEVGDGGGSGVESVRVRYSTDGQGWRERPLRLVGPGRYEGGIDGLRSASEVRFEVVASDWMNNTATSPRDARSLGVPQSTLLAAMVGVASAAAFVAILFMMIRHRKVRRYLEMKRPHDKT
jgi:NAD-dependent dihydropyrimidine dehydrogenase PreA subunit